MSRVYSLDETARDAVIARLNAALACWADVLSALVFGS